MKRFFILCTVLILQTEIYAQSYTYDANGNLFTDLNKQIASLHYNYLNLVDTITYQDGRKIIYGYSNTGQKLEQQILTTDGTLIRKQDYVDNFQYVNDTLKIVQYGDDRLVPTISGNQNTPWEYQYTLKDHLGSVRTLLTSAQSLDNAQGTFETSNTTSGQSKFLRLEDTRKVNSVLFDHTKKGTTHYAQRLNGSVNEKYGLARSLSVMPGDTVKLEVFAKYVASNSVDLTSALTTLLSQIISGTASAGTVVDGTNYAGNGSTPFPFAGMNNTSQNTQAGPKAYLNWLVFDRNFALKTGGYKKMSTIARENGTNVSHEKLATQLVITSPGYVYTYLSNEETNPLEVYFDDFTVTQVKGPIVQESDYDPFGLTLVQNTRENSAANNFLYNDKELQNDFDLNWYDYGARMYDAALGRWHVIDLKAEKYADWSPYNYVLNDPINKIDPDGHKPIKVINVNVVDKSRLQQVLRVIESTPEGAGLVNRIRRSDKTVTISIGSLSRNYAEGVTEPADERAATSKGEILDDGDTGTGKGSDATVDIGRLDSNDELVATVTHELDHADKIVRGESSSKTVLVCDNQGSWVNLSIEEILATNKENQVLSRLGKPITRSYGRIPLIDKAGVPLINEVDGVDDLPKPEPDVSNKDIRKAFFERLKNIHISGQM